MISPGLGRVTGMPNVVVPALDDDPDERGGLFSTLWR
jgi:hypothetical protein